MSLLGGRGGRSDDWKSQHLRARARASERLDGPLDPAEEAWLDDHLAGCAACSAAAADYASQRLELRALRDHTPLPPRDLWARTAAAIEREAAPQARNRRRPMMSLLGPYALLAGAVIVAVTVGTLSLSQTATPTPTAVRSPAGTATGQPVNQGATPIPVLPGSVAYLTQNGGSLQLNHLEFNHVCGPTAKCATSAPTDSRTIGPVASPDTVFGAATGDKPLVVFSDVNGSGGKVFAIAVPDQGPVVSPSSKPSPSPTATATTPPPSPSATPTPSASTPPPSTPPSPSPSEPAVSPPSSEPPTPSPSASLPASVVEIARDLDVLDTTAAYAPDGSAFAFTAQPSDGSHGPDIYLWRVGDAQAVPVTTDHRSVFGSWARDSIVGSTVTPGPSGRLERPMAFVLRTGDTEPTLLPQTGLAWRPVVDPTGRTAVYWSGRLEATADGLGWTTRNGKLVVGRWDDVAATAPSADVSPGPSATPPAESDQPTARSETTLATGPLTDWDARWDETGRRLAVWIADPGNPVVGRLSLYAVDPFDGRIDLSKPPLVDEPALAGFAITDDHLAWAAPPSAGSTESSVLVLAWTGDAFGQIESAPGDVILVR